MKNVQLYIIAFIVVLLGVVYFMYFNKEGFSNYNLGNAMGDFPNAIKDVLVQSIFPRINPGGLTDNNASDIWWHYPTFQLGSYAQITNNIRYSNNPDVGRCTPASMCGSLYNDRDNKSNYTHILPPVNNSCGTRVNYYTTPNWLFNVLRNEYNVLY